MSRFWQMLIFFCYVTLASALVVLVHQLVPGIGILTSLLVGLVFFLACALLQETYARRNEAVIAMRRLLLLKRALDRNREEMTVARDEIRRLFEAVEDGGGEKISAALDALTQSQRYEAQRYEAQRYEASPFEERGGEARSPFPDPRPPETEAEADARSLLERMAAREDNRPVEQETPAYDPFRPREAAAATPRDRNAEADRSLREASAEVRVLHNLVEQLYAGREKPPVTLSEESVSLGANAARREPTLRRSSFEAPVEEPVQAEGNGFGRAIRNGLRVVSGAAGGGAAALAQSEPTSVEDHALLATVREALKEDRVDLYLQPIVSLPQRKRRFYECFSRIRAASGEIIGPDRYLEVAKEARLLTAIDNMLLFRCVQLLRKLRRKDFSAAFFCNIAPHTLSDREFFRDFIEYMESHSELAPNLVLEFSQAEIGGSLTDFAPDFARLGGLGYRFSLDGVTDVDLDLDALEEMHFAFLKIDAQTVLHRLDRGGADANALLSLKQDVDGRGIDLIVDRIETEATLVELLDFNIDFGQGYLFGEPRQSKEPAG